MGSLLFVNRGALVADLTDQVARQVAIKKKIDTVVLIPKVGPGKKLWLLSVTVGRGRQMCKLNDNKKY